MSNYDRFPATKIKGYENTAVRGYDAIFDVLKEKMQGKKVLVMEAYPGVSDDLVLEQIKKLEPTLVIDMRKIFKDEKTLNEQLQYHITDDRIFGRMYYGNVIDFIDLERLEAAKKEVKEAQGLVVVYGFGASFVAEHDVLVYLDMARWEITLRYRKGLPNYNCTNYDEDSLRKIKRGFFIEWRVADKHKMTCFEDVDYFIDTNNDEDVKMVPGEGVRDGLRQIASQPFRTVPYFDPGVWGGQWMKEVCNLDKDQDNYAWSFDGVPEENSLYLDFENATIEIPAMDLVLYQPKELLGKDVFARFGAEFPIRFDFLDTIGGQNLSLQVHPLTEYIHRQFGMAYTQDESYYILDAKEGASVYLGLKEGIDSNQMIEDLRSANRGEIIFDAEKYINNGVILVNMKAFRDKKFVDKFYYLMNKYHFDNVDPDQAYMNEICEDKIYHLPKEWDAMPNESIPEIQDPKIVHYNLFFKPWHFADVQYGHYFWDVAKTTPYYDELKQQLDNFTDEDRQKARADLEWMAKKVDMIVKEPNTWAKVKQTESVKI